MTEISRYSLIGALTALVFAGVACSPPPAKTDGGTGGGGGTDECLQDSDCPDAQLFFCNTATSKCEPACRTKDDCGAAKRGQYALDYCASGLGCQCDEGKCVGSLCSADTDCGSQVCRNGACVDAPAASTVTSCQVTPDFVVMKAGEKAKFWVSAWDAAKKPVVLKTGVSWSAADPAVTGSGTAVSAEFTAGAAAAGPVAAVKATIGGASCTAQVIVIPAAVAAGSVTAVVTDELTGRPVVGAQVLLSDATTGAAIGTATATDAKGTATIAGAAGPTVTVTAFHADYNYLTIGNYAVSGSRLLSMVLRRNQSDKYGGYKGTFTKVPMTPNVHAGIAGASLAGSITDLSVGQLLGATVPTDIKIGSAIDQKGVPLPAGVYLGFTDQNIKPTVSAQGLAGVCYTSTGAPDETSINAGTCGTRTAWALAGDVPLGDLPIDAVAGGVDNIDFGKVLSRIIPIFKKFNSSIVRDVQFTLKTTPKKANGDYDFSDTSSYTAADHEFTQIPLAFNFAAEIPDLPKFKGNFADGVVLLGGANVQGRGVVPLGIGVAVNTNPVDAKTDTQAELPKTGLVSMRMAPTHHGTEGGDYGVVALALSLKSIQDASAGLATSAIFQRLDGNRLAFDPKGTTPVKIGAAFPAFPENARYNYTDTPNGALGARTFKFTVAPAADAQVVRVVFTNAAEHRWVVFMDPAQATTGFVLPKPPGALVDRTYENAMVATSPRAPMLVQTLQLKAGGAQTGAAITFANLVELNSNNADRITDFTTGFTLLDYNRPEVAFKTPDAAGKTIAKGSSVVVTVTGFKVGTTSTDDGFVKVNFTQSGTNTMCASVDVDGKTDASMGKGEISVVVPASGCTGAVTITATLYDNATPAKALAPPVSASTTATIQ